MLAITYPLEPSQISLIGMFTIGLPGFLLALEPNRERIEGHFIRNVLLKALPAGLLPMGRSASGSRGAVCIREAGLGGTWPRNG